MYNSPLPQQPLLPPQQPIHVLYQAPLILNGYQVVIPVNAPHNVTQNIPPPQNYNPIPNPSPQIINPPPPPIQKPTLASDSLEYIELSQDLDKVNRAQVSKYFEGGFMGYGRRHKYRVSISYNDGSLRNIFICKKNLSITSNEYEVRMKYIPRDSTSEILNTKDFNKRFIDIISSEQQEFMPKLLVRLIENDTVLGNIQQPKKKNSCCCDDANYQIFPRFGMENIPKFIVRTNGCQCSYCCIPPCYCVNSQTNFEIFNPTTNVVNGNIIKLPFGSGVFLNYDIIFPNDITSEEKILFICTAIGIDSAVYQEQGANL